ncbi:MAG: aldo/keto reductase [Caulobacteraceae bacterium]|nr:aldo/keto reductase [Caulobacter sp.]
MQTRQLGQTAIHTAPLVFGGNVFGWTVEKDRGFELLDAFVDEGFTMVDTADVYSKWVDGHEGGESETMIGAWLHARGRRDRVQIATKVGMMGPLTADNIAKSIDASLKRLKTDYVDLYYSHQDDADTPLEETLEAYGRLIKAGKVRAIAASNYSAGRLEEAERLSTDKDLPRYEALQPEYNLMERGFEQDLAPLCRRDGVGVLTYSSLASGFLSGKYRKEEDTEGKARGGRVKDYVVGDRGPKVLAALDEVAQAHGANDAQVAIAWVIANPAVTAAIASATSLDQLRDLTAAARLELTAEEKAKLDAASA